MERSSSLTHPGEIGFFPKLGHSDRCCCAPLSAASQARCQPQHARPLTPLSDCSPKFSVPRVHDVPLLTDARRQPGSPAVTRCAQRAFCADRCAARRPQANQTHHLRDNNNNNNKKVATILIIHKMQNKKHRIQIVIFICRFDRSGCFSPILSRVLNSA